MLTHTPNAIIGPGPELMDALLTPAVARCWLDSAELTLCSARAELLRHDLDVVFHTPDAWWAAESCWQHAHSDDARERLTRRVARCRAAARTARARLARVEARAVAADVATNQRRHPMTIEELSARLQAIGAYALVRGAKSQISIQVERNNRPLSDGFFYGPVTDAETLLAQAEARAARQEPGDAEFESWFAPRPLALAAE